MAAADKRDGIGDGQHATLQTDLFSRGRILVRQSLLELLCGCMSLLYHQYFKAQLERLIKEQDVV